jgi:transcriptional regulator with XRE-family HTH domain
VQNIRRRIGARIRELRLKREWSQEELADRANLHPNFIGAAERGEQNLSLASLVKISKTLGVKLVDLVRGIDD